MREIKFRAWDSESNKYFDPTHEAYRGMLEDLMVGMKGDLFIHNMRGVAHESTFPNRFILEQYTGLKDKNGREIYEGDILKASGHAVEVVFEDWGQWVVWFVGGWFPLNDYIASDPEIIGNIHENKDIMEIYEWKKALFSNHMK